MYTVVLLVLDNCLTISNTKSKSKSATVKKCDIHCGLGLDWLPSYVTVRHKIR